LATRPAARTHRPSIAGYIIELIYSRYFLRIIRSPLEGIKILPRAIWGEMLIMVERKEDNLT
jgi:hypothetical protein